MERAAISSEEPAEQASRRHVLSLTKDPRLPGPSTRTVASLLSTTAAPGERHTKWEPLQWKPLHGKEKAVTARGQTGTSVLQPGCQLDGWTIEATLGSGGMGVVYRASHAEKGLVAALKILVDADDSGGEVSRRFRREVKALARIRHPGIVHVLQEALDNSPPFFAMELVEGGTLAARIEEAQGPRGRMEPAALLGILTDLAEGLEAIHAENIIHRDIKPSNVLFTAEGRAKLADFGMAKAMDLTGLTMGNRVMGTLPYMAPEMLRALPADPRSDLYQLGVTLFEAATGRRPYSGEQLLRVTSGDQLPPLPRMAGLKPDSADELQWLQPLLSRMTAGDRNDRFQSASELLAVLRLGPDSRIDTSTRRSRTPEAGSPILAAGPASPGERLKEEGARNSEEAAEEASKQDSRKRRGSSRSGRRVRTTQEVALFVWPAPWRIVAGMLVLVLISAAIAWGIQHRRTSSRPRTGQLSVAPAVQPPPPAPPASKPKSASTPPLPAEPVLVGLPDATLLFAKGSPPDRIAATLESMKLKPGRLSAGDGIWQITLGPEAAKLQALNLPGLSPARLITGPSGPFERFGDELEVIKSGNFATQYYPGVREETPQLLGMAVGRLVTPSIPDRPELANLVRNCQGPRWLELQLTLTQLPADWPHFEAELTRALKQLAPCLRAVSLGRDINSGGWAGTPGQLANLIDRTAAIARRVIPDVPVRPGAFGLDSQSRPADIQYFLSLASVQRLETLELHVQDIGSNWIRGLQQARTAAAKAGLGDRPWSVILQRLPRLSPLRTHPSEGKHSDDIEVREILRAAVKSVAAGLRQVWFAALRETHQGPILINIFSAATTGEIEETRGGGAPAFRYVLTRLAEASPSRTHLPAGAQGVVLESGGRRLWFLWKPDGQGGWVEVPVRTAAALVSRVSPVVAWNRPGAQPITIHAAQEGHITAYVDDGLVVVEELTL